MADRILIHLPSYYLQIADFVKLAETESIELDLMKNAVEQLFNDQFVETSGLQSVIRREKMLGIQADPTTENIEFRRRRIINRYQTKPPFTERYLQQQLDLLVGKGLTIVSVDVDNFLLIVTAEIVNASVFREVIYTINKIKPANIVYQQNTSINDGIELKERISRRAGTWNYKLDGSWKLGEKGFISFGQEVVIK